MRLQDRIINDNKIAIMRRDMKTSEYLSLIISEFQRQPTKEVADDKAAKILKGLMKSQEELKSSGKADIKFIEIIHKYLPVPSTKEDIKKWIDENIDFSQYKNKMMAMKPIMQHFAGNADGNVVKEILQNIE